LSNFHFTKQVKCTKAIIPPSKLIAMKKKLPASHFVSFFLLLLFGQPLKAQSNQDNQNVLRYASVVEKFVYTNHNPLPSAIYFKPTASLTIAAALDSLKQAFNLSEFSSWQLKQESKGAADITHLRYQQTYKNVPVIGGEYILHTRNNQTFAANGNCIPEGEISIIPNLTESEALKLALNTINATSYQWQNGSNQEKPKGLQVIFPQRTENEKQNWRLCWCFDIYALQPLSRQIMYIDAHSGELIYSENEICAIDVVGTADTWYNGTQNMTCDNYTSGQYRLQESGRGQGIATVNMQQGTNPWVTIDFTSTSTNWQQNSLGDHAAYDAHWAAEKLYDYLLFEYGQNSLDDNGMPLRSYIHYDTLFDGAFWDGQSVFYGDGTQQPGGTNPFVSVDVCGHEFSHGLLQYSCGLGHTYESGSLNESYADIFGTMLEFYASSSTADFFIAEDCFYDAGRMLRNMQDPNSMQMPDTYHGNYWYYGNADYGGIHTNCNVQNYWFYLLCNGGSGVNDLGNVYTLNPLGMEVAGQIVYHTIKNYLTSTASFEDARMASLLATADLFGDCSPELRAVTNAWYAVGLGDEFPYPINAAFTYQTNPVAPSLFQVSVQGNASTPGYFDWDFNPGLASGTTAQHFYTDYGTHTINMVFTSDMGCTISATTEIILDDVIIPNVITPNNDHINDGFVVAGTPMAHYRLTIWDRWGRTILNTNSPNEIWYGNASDGTACEAGTYFYQLEAISESGKNYNRTGFITLIR
jgi:gliding motility-associated-like protein